MNSTNLTIFDLLLKTDIIKLLNFKESSHFKDYKVFFNKLDTEKKEELSSIKYYIESYCEEVSMSNCMKVLDVGIKIGMDLQKSLFENDT